MISAPTAEERAQVRRLLEDAGTYSVVCLDRAGPTVWPSSRETILTLKDFLDTQHAARTPTLRWIGLELLDVDPTTRGLAAWLVMFDGNRAAVVGLPQSN